MQNINILLDIIQKHGEWAAMIVLGFLFIRKYGIYIVKGYAAIDLWIKMRESIDTEERQNRTEEREDRKEMIRLLNEISSSFKILATKDDIIQLQNKMLNSYMNKDVVNA